MPESKARIWARVVGEAMAGMAIGTLVAWLGLTLAQRSLDHHEPPMVDGIPECEAR